MVGRRFMRRRSRPVGSGARPIDPGFLGRSWWYGECTYIGSMKAWGAFAAVLVMGCSAPPEDAEAPDATDADEINAQVVVRELSCNADARQRHASFHLRLSSDGKVREGTVLRGFAKDSPDARVDVKSVTKVGDRLRIEAVEGENHVRFTISASGFAAKTRAPLDAKVEETTDQAILDAGGLECTLSDSMSGLVMIGDDAKRLYEGLRVDASTTNVGDSVKVVDVKGPFRLYCKPDLCTLRVPAIVAAVAGGKVSYAYDLDAPESKALSAALAAGSFTGTTFEDAWSGARAEGAKMVLTCTSGACKASYTIPDSFYADVR